MWDYIFQKRMHKHMLSKRKLFACALIILLAVYMLAPRLWEPSAESLKNWSSARIFRETGAFPVLHHGPLYNIYLQLFLFFDFPRSIQLEHFVTHLFAYICIFLLLQRFLPVVLALLLTCAWIPTLWTVEGGARIAGMGFLALYLRADKKSILNKGYFPISLGAATLSAFAYLPFFLGHVVGTAIEKLSNRESLVAFAPSLRRDRIIPAIIKTAMIGLVILTVLFQSKRSDNNVHAFNYPWSPVPQKEILSEACLQIGNWKYAMRSAPASEQIYQDWYFTNNEAFGGASNILQAALNSPKVFFRNVASEFFPFVMVPVNFTVGFRDLPRALKFVVMPLLWVLWPIGFYKVFQYFKMNNLISKVYSIIFGTSAVTMALFLTWFKCRYTIVLLPVALLITAHLGTVFRSVFMVKRSSFLGIFKQLKNSPYANTQSWFTSAITLVMAGCILTSAPYYIREGRTGILSGNPFLLSGRMTGAYSQLVSGIERDTRVLALEEPWIKSFTDIDPDNAFHALYLPPFKDASGRTEEFLNSLDVIWVSDVFSRKSPSAATQRYLRYELHVEPFLKKALRKGWTVEEVKGFGKVYRRPRF